MHTVLLFCSEDNFQKSFDQLERIALQLTQRYTVRRDVLKVILVIPFGKSANYSDVYIQDGSDKHIYGTFEISNAPELYVVRPDGYIAYYARPADADKVLQFLSQIFV